jgi:endogenous inhibitor of DNA gyrase (YacG/DUF329 family)
MSIYIPFTYIIGWTIHNKFYYGAKYAAGCHPNDLWKIYFTSSEKVKKFREENGEPDIIKIRKTFPNNPKKCLSWEHKFLKRIDAANNTKFLNSSNGGIGWSNNKGKVSVKDKDDNTFSVSVDDHRYISGELVHVMTGVKRSEEFKKERSNMKRGTVNVKDKDGNTFSVSVDDHRYISGELTFAYTGFTTVKDNKGNIFKVSTSDPRYISGELVHVNKGRVFSQIHKNKLKCPRKLKIVTCPKCGKEGSGGNMTRYHFDNCGLKREKIGCPKCGKMIEGSGNLRQHMRSSYCDDK